MLFQVFDRALNESIKSIGTKELEDSSGGYDAQPGSDMSNAFVNMMNNAETKMQESYANIAKLQKLEEIIRNSMNSEGDADNSAYGMDAVEGQLSAVIVNEKQKEKERLTAAIQQLDGDVRRTRDVLSRLKAQVQNEIAAATEECQKMSVAAAQIGRNQVQ